jgi:hypothetical protein
MRVAEALGRLIVNDFGHGVERPKLADWVKSATAAYEHSGSQKNLVLLTDRFGENYLTGLGRRRASYVFLASASSRMPRSGDSRHCSVDATRSILRV